MESKMNCGIYQIRNKINNKVIYGSSKNFHIRKNKHFNYLRKNKHWNQKLQNAFNKYGEENFIFEKLIICEEKDLLFYEQLFIDYNFKHNEGGYNLAKSAVSPMKGRKMTQSAKDKIGRKGEKNHNFGKKLSYEHRKKLSESHKGIRQSEETKQKISLARKGKKHTEEAKLKVSLARKGKKLSEETKQKISLSKMGKKHTEEHKQKISLSTKGRVFSEEHKQKISLANRKNKETIF